MRRFDIRDPYLNLHHVEIQAGEISGRDKIRETVNPAYARHCGCPDLVNVSSRVKKPDIHHSVDQAILIASNSSLLSKPTSGTFLPASSRVD